LGRSILNDPKQAVLVGDVIKVLVMQVEKETQKVSLSIKGAVKLPLTRPETRRRNLQSSDAEHREEREGGRRGSFGRSRDNEQQQQFNRPGRPQGDGRPQQRRKAGKGDIAVPRVHGASAKKGEDALLNTTLAEQLAALREKIVSGK
jgi:hypothetical protein